VQPEGVQAALVARSFGCPFRLIPCDWESDVMSGAPPTGADTFTHDLVNIVGWMHYMEEPTSSIEKAKTVIAAIYEEEHILPGILANHTVHLFSSRTITGRSTAVTARTLLVSLQTVKTRTDSAHPAQHLCLMIFSTAE